MHEACMLWRCGCACYRKVLVHFAAQLCTRNQESYACRRCPLSSTCGQLSLHGVAPGESSSAAFMRFRSSAGPGAGGRRLQSTGRAPYVQCHGTYLRVLRRCAREEAWQQQESPPTLDLKQVYQLVRTRLLQVPVHDEVHVVRCQRHGLLSSEACTRKEWRPSELPKGSVPSRAFCACKQPL